MYFFSINTEHRLRVSKSRAPGKIYVFALKGEKVRKVFESCMKGFMLRFFLTNTNHWVQIKDDEVNWTCSTHERDMHMVLQAENSSEDDVSI